MRLLYDLSTDGLVQKYCLICPTVIDGVRWIIIIPIQFYLCGTYYNKTQNTVARVIRYNINR